MRLPLRSCDCPGVKQARPAPPPGPGSRPSEDRPLEVRLALRRACLAEWPGHVARTTVILKPSP